MRYGRLKGLQILIAVLASAPLCAVKAESVDLPPQSLSSALQALGNQTKINVLFSADGVEGLRSPAIVGARDIEDALNQLLVGTGTYRFTNADTVTLIRASAQKSSEAKAGQAAVDSLARGANSEKLTSLMALSSAQNASVQKNSYQSTASDNKAQDIEEIVVTAQKREERLLEVPISIVALGDKELRLEFPGFRGDPITIHESDGRMGNVQTFTQSERSACLRIYQSSPTRVSHRNDVPGSECGTERLLRVASKAGL